MALLSRQDYDRVIEALEFYLESHKEAPDFDSLGYNNLVNWLKICVSKGDQLSGRALALQARCHWFDPGISHCQESLTITI